MAESFEERQTVMLEGMYKGVASKIDELKQSIDKELQNSGEQQVSASEAITENFRQGVESMLAELRYLSQQNSAIYDYSKSERASAQEAMATALNERCEDIVSAVTDYVDKLGKSIYEQLNAKIEQMGKDLMQAIQLVPQQVPSFITVEQRSAEEPVQETVQRPVQEVHVPAVFSDETFDYNLLAEKIASMLPETDYDTIADKVVEALPQQDENLFVDKVVAAIPQQDENALADKLAEVIPLTDYDLIAEKVSNVLENEFEVTVSGEGLSRITSAVVQQLDYDRIAAKV
ncbi:MAG: hypothetical protein K2K12_01050, partial [Clostridia bacterium]|nr:hypothetical protein [Clostridia bacterium]